MALAYCMSRRSFAAGAAVTAGAAAFAGRTWAASFSRPNVVVIVVDDMRFDEHGAGGHPYLKTPAIDALGAGGASFRNAYHATPLCSPNRASILTGQYASTHGILDNTSRAYASRHLHVFAQELQTRRATKPLMWANGIWETTRRRGRATTTG